MTELKDIISRLEMTLFIAKKALRQELKQKLKSMSSENRSKQSQAVFMKLLQNEKYHKSSKISVYLSRDIEVDTQPVLLDIFQAGKQCFIPKYDPKSTQMDMVQLKSIEEYKNLPLTSWNIKQPDNTVASSEEALSVGGLDLVIVPGIGFTKDGLRIGNGKGYYDIYLKKHQEMTGLAVHTIALAYKEQIVPFIPTDDHDMKIDEVIVAD